MVNRSEVVTPKATQASRKNLHISIRLYNAMACRGGDVPNVFHLLERHARTPVVRLDLARLDLVDNAAQQLAAPEVALQVVDFHAPDSIQPFLDGIGRLARRVDNEHLAR